MTKESMRIYTERDLLIADDIAAVAHGDQMRMDGSMYIEHPRRTSRMARAMGYSIATQILLLVHDVPEDCEGWSVERVGQEGNFGNDVLYPLQLMTKEPGRDQDYYLNTYIPRIATHSRSRAGKRFDLFDNMSLTGIENPSPKQIDNIEKYGKAMVHLSRFPQPLV